MEKKCSKCSEVKSLELFDKKKGGKFGRRGYCIECRKKQVAKHREENLEAVKEQRSREYRDNADVIKIQRAEYYQENADEVKERMREYYDTNKAERCAYNRQYQKDNITVIQSRNQRYRARLKELPNNLTSEQLASILAVFDGGCALTGSVDFHLDHVIPLATGNGGTTLGNIIPLRSDLNISKSDGNLFTWFEANRGRFDLSEDMFDRLVDHLAEANAMTTQEYREYYYSVFTSVG